MAEAKRPGGLYYVGDKAVDANGVEITNAPKRQADTDPSQQPGAFGASTPEERIGLAIARAMADPKAALAAHGVQTPASTSKASESDELPTVADLDDHLAGLASAAEVKALQKRDNRVTAEPKYAKRLAELQGE